MSESKDKTPAAAEPKPEPAKAEKPTAKPAAEPAAKQAEKPKAAEPAKENTAPAAEEATFAEQVASAVAAVKDELADRIDSALGALDRSKAEFDETKTKLRTEVAALSERISGAFGKLRQSDEADVVPGSGDPQQIVLRRAATIADKKRDVGHVIGAVVLAEGVSLDYLVDAVRSRIAGAKVK